MQDGNVFSDPPLGGKMHDDNSLTDSSGGKKEEAGWHRRQCPLHYICFHFDTNLFVLSFKKYFKK